MSRLVEILYFDGCPNHPATVELVRETARELGTEIELRLVRVADGDDAVRQRFLGSPTVRVDGSDVEPGADERESYSLACRAYGLPRREWLEAALRPMLPSG